MTEVKEIPWKNLKGIQLENEELSVVVLPSLGGKIASVYHKKHGFELAAQCEKEQYELPLPGADFSKYDASGLDDAFPNITEAKVELNGETYAYPDHGEIWSSHFDAGFTDRGVDLQYESELFGYVYQKKVCLSRNRISLEYEIENIKAKPLPCIWTFHGLMRYEEDMEIFYGEDVKAFQNVFPSRELGAVDTIYPKDNKVYDFTRVPVMQSHTMIKYYIAGEKKEGVCGYRYPAQRMECRYHYDPKQFPYLGVWITAGGYCGDYNCALEPANGYYDDIRTAEKNQSLYYLEKGKALRLSLEVEVCSY